MADGTGEPPAYRMGAIRYGLHRTWGLRNHWVWGTGGVILAMLGSGVYAVAAFPESWSSVEAFGAAVALSLALLLGLSAVLVAVLAVRSPHDRFNALADWVDSLVPSAIGQEPTTVLLVSADDARRMLSQYIATATSWRNMFGPTLLTGSGPPDDFAKRLRKWEDNMRSDLAECCSAWPGQVASLTSLGTDPSLEDAVASTLSPGAHSALASELRGIILSLAALEGSLDQS